MAQSLANLIKSNTKPMTIEEEFVHNFYVTKQRMNNAYKPTPGSFSPSSISKCSRELYYRYVGAERDPDLRTPEQAGPLFSILENGNDRHERIQAVISKMQENGIDVRWVDVGEFVNQFKPDGTSVLKKQGFETKLVNSVLELRFLCDGVIIYKGEYFIVEIKTMHTKKWYDSKQSNTPYPDHIDQAATYSLALGINKVMFLYEDRNMMGLLPIIHVVTEEERQKIVNKIFNVKNYVELGCVPPKTNNCSKCTYCEYKRQCAIDGETARLGDYNE